MSKYALAGTSGISREYIGRVERGDANPALIVVAQISHGVGLTLKGFAEWLEDERSKTLRRGGSERRRLGETQMRAHG